MIKEIHVHPPINFSEIKNRCCLCGNYNIKNYKIRAVNRYQYYIRKYQNMYCCNICYNKEIIKLTQRRFKINIKWNKKYNFNVISIKKNVENLSRIDLDYQNIDHNLINLLSKLSINVDGSDVYKIKLKTTNRLINLS